MFKERFVLTLSRETTIESVSDYSAGIPIDYRIFAKEFLVDTSDLYGIDTSLTAFNEYFTEELKKAVEGLAERILNNG